MAVIKKCDIYMFKGALEKSLIATNTIDNATDAVTKIYSKMSLKERKKEINFMKENKGRISSEFTIRCLEGL